MNTETYPHGIGTDENGEWSRTRATHEQQQSIVFDGTRGRYTRSGLQFDLDVNRIVHMNYISTFDGTKRYSLFDKQMPHNVPIAGYVELHDSLLGTGWSYHSAPVLMAFRPLTPSLQGVNPRSWEFQDDRHLVDGRPLLLCSTTRFDYLVDPANEHVLLRLDYFRRDDRSRGPAIRTEISYRNDPVWGTVPDKWTIVEVNVATGEVVMRIDGATTHVDFNVPVRDEEFVIDFPKGTLVYDDYAQVKAVVREDGSYRILDRGELRTDTPIDTLLNSEAPSVVSTRRARWGYVATLLIVILATLGVVRIRRRR